MTKDEIEIAKPLVPLIFTGILKGYMKGSFSFMCITALTFPLFLRRCPENLPKDLVKTAGFMAHLYLRLQKRMPKEKAFEIARASILTSAFSVMQANFRFVEEERTFENLIKYQKMTNKTGITKLNTMEVVKENDSIYYFKVTRCMFHELFSQLGVEELTSVMCAVDNAVFNCYLPNELVFDRKYGETIAEGSKSCCFRVKKEDK